MKKQQVSCSRFSLPFWLPSGLVAVAFATHSSGMDTGEAILVKGLFKSSLAQRWVFVQLMSQPFPSWGEGFSLTGALGQNEEYICLSLDEMLPW